MASPTTSKRAIRYFRAHFNDGVSQSLQQLLATAIGKKAKIQDRLQTIDAAATATRFISRCKEEDGFLCGHLTMFERGSWQIVIADDPNATELTFEAVQPPTDKKTAKQQQWVQGALFFVIVKNHVAVVQSQALKASAFEHYLAWLLRDKAELLTAKQGFALVDEPMPATEARIRKAHIKSVRLGRPLLDEAQLDEAVISPGKKASHVFKATGAMVQIIKELMDSTQFEKLGLEDRVLEGNLELWVELRHPSRIRSKPEDAVRLLDDLALGLRSLDEDEVQLQLADGTRVKGKDLRVTGDVTFSISKGVPVEIDLFNNMREWLRNQIKNGLVKPD